VRLLHLVSVAAFLLAPRAFTIMSLQGDGLTSPFATDSVATTGIVTAIARDGFYVQDAVGDANDATSDAVFVRSVANVFVGDEVRLVGVVSEFLPSSDPANLTVTEITRPAVTRLRAGVSLPAPVCMAPNGRVPDGLLSWESLEGMRVCVRTPHVVQGTYSGSYCWVVPDGVARSRRGALAAGPGNLHPERVQLSLPAMPAFNVGDVLGDLTGVVSYRSGNYELVPDATPVRTVARHLSREVTALSSGNGRLRIAAFNLHNLMRTDTERIAEIGRVVVSQLGAPEILGVEEIVDDSGEQDDGVVDATLTLRVLVAAIRDADGPSYDFREIIPADGSDGGAPGNNIRQALLFDARRVSFVERGDSFGDAATRVVADGGRPHLTRSPGRIDPSNPAWVASRKPLASDVATLWLGPTAGGSGRPETPPTGRVDGLIRARCTRNRSRCRHRRDG
jgi:predicted extracellular nuclease